MAKQNKTQPKEVTRELVAAWEQKRPALKALNDATLNKDRGYAITKARVVEIAGDEDEFNKVAAFWKRSILWLKGITIEYEHASKSYRFIEVERHLTNRHERILRGQERKHREESIRLALVRDADMQSDHQRKLRVLQMDQHNKCAGMIESQREATRIAITQPETLPRLSMS